MKYIVCSGHNVYERLFEMRVYLNGVPLQSATLEQEKLKSGDLLLIEEGKLPPKVTTFADS